MTSKEIKEMLRPVFDKYGRQVIFAYVFGSAARDEPRPLSDMDIAVFLSDKEFICKEIISRLDDVDEFIRRIKASLFTDNLK